MHRLPLVGVNHLEGHIYAAFLDRRPARASRSSPSSSRAATPRSTTRRAPLTYTLVGPDPRRRRRARRSTRSPSSWGSASRAGPSSSARPSAAIPSAIAFPLAQMSDGAPDFSFSGIKTVGVALRASATGPLGAAAGRRRGRVVPGDGREDAGAQDRARGARASASSASCSTGGVAANGALRDGARAPSAPSTACACTSRRARLCTDNAAMIAAAGTDRAGAPGERAAASTPERRRPDLALALSLRDGP